jgi:ABC-type lipoprotein export system ATPase subunit
MIHSLKITSGYAKKLPAVKRANRIKFSPSLNILWGPNGCGKTSILEIIAAHTFCYSGGWTRLLDPMELAGLGKSESIELPAALSYKSPGNCKAVLDWDRVPVFFANGKDEGMGHFILEKARDTTDGITDPMEALFQKMTPRSSGERRRAKLNQIQQMLQSAPDFRKTKVATHVNQLWQGVYQKQLDYLKQIPNEPRITVLFDEPERHLDLRTSDKFWRELIPHISKYAQVFVATHHPLALQHIKTAVWITPEKGEEQTAFETYQTAFSPK